MSMALSGAWGKQGHCASNQAPVLWRLTLTTFAGRWMTSPAAMRFTTSSSSFRITGAAPSEGSPFSILALALKLN
jgi:hypothetical protein